VARGFGRVNSARREGTGFSGKYSPSRGFVTTVSASATAASRQAARSQNKATGKRGR